MNRLSILQATSNALAELFGFLDINRYPGYGSLGELLPQELEGGRYITLANAIQIMRSPPAPDPAPDRVSCVGHGPRTRVD